MPLGYLGFYVFGSLVDVNAPPWGPFLTSSTVVLQVYSAVTSIIFSHIFGFSYSTLEVFAFVTFGFLKSVPLISLSVVFGLLIFIVGLCSVDTLCSYGGFIKIG